MFDPKITAKLQQRHRSTLSDLREVEDHLNSRFADMAPQIRALILAMASGEALLLVGPPGTAKSRLVRALCQCLGFLNEKMQPASSGQGYFEYLLTPFTEPSELFGYFNLKEAMIEGNFSRIEEGMMQNAKVVFLDEIFNASSAILNSLLSFMNERKFHDRGVTRDVALKCLFSATNQIPSASELRAVFDRFLLRVWVDNEPEEPNRIEDLIAAGWRETHGHSEVPVKPTLLGGLERLRSDIEARSGAGELVPVRGSEDYVKLSGLIRQMRRSGLSEVSNRRLIKFIRVMLINMLYRQSKGDTRPGLQPEDRLCLLRYGADQDTQAQVSEIENRDLTKY